MLAFTLQWITNSIRTLFQLEFHSVDFFPWSFLLAFQFYGRHTYTRCVTDSFDFSFIAAQTIITLPFTGQFGISPIPKCNSCVKGNLFFPWLHAVIFNFTWYPVDMRILDFHHLVHFNYISNAKQIF